MHHNQGLKLMYHYLYIHYDKHETNRGGGGMRSVINPSITPDISLTAESS